MTNNFTRLFLGCFLTCLLIAPVLGLAQASQSEIDEMAGTGDGPPSELDAPDPAAREAALGAMGDGGLLLIPESTNDRVMAFDPMTGDLIDPDFIPADPANLSTPIEAVLSPDGSLIYVSDQIEDVVQAYDVNTGAFVSTFAPAGGADTSILNNIRGIAYRPNGNLLVSVGAASNDDAIAEFDSGGNYVGNFVANGAGGLDSPFDVFAVVQAGGVLASGDFLVPGITSDAVHRYDSTGAPQANFASLNTFGEQIAQASNGNVLVANFSGTQEGVVEFMPDGSLLDIYDPATLGGYRGVYELPNGNILTTNGGGVHEIDRSGNLIETKIGGVSARFIALVGGGGGEPPPARATFGVQKIYFDLNPTPVEVTLSCNTGLPLEQTTTLEPDPTGEEYIEFVVNDFASGELDCEITESVPEGYFPVYFWVEEGTVFEGEDGCFFEDVEHGDFADTTPSEVDNFCIIVNVPEVSEVTVTKEWIDENMQFNTPNYAEASWFCSNLPDLSDDIILPPLGQSPVLSSLAGGGNTNSGNLEFIGNPGVDSFFIIGNWDGGTMCDVTEQVVEGGVETDDSDCQGLVIGPGEDVACTIVNTRLFEGIPTLSQYGLGLLALLMLGMGFVAYRRVV